jgi:ribosomal subunit interface protein
MNINIKATNLEHTEAIDAYVRDKIGALGKFIDLTNNQVFLYVEIEKTKPNKQNGEDLYRAEITVDNASEMFYADVASHDLYAAIDVLKDEIVGKVSKMRNKKRDILRRSMGKIKNILRWNS